MTAGQPRAYKCILGSCKSIRFCDPVVSSRLDPPPKTFFPRARVATGCCTRESYRSCGRNIFCLSLFFILVIATSASRRGEEPLWSSQGRVTAEANVCHNKSAFNIQKQKRKYYAILPDTFFPISSRLADPYFAFIVSHADG